MSSEEVLLDEQIPVSAKIAYGSASSAHMFISGIGLGVIDIFYLKATSITPIAMAWSWFFFIIWNMINDPIIGVLQDNTKSKLGRRIPYLRYGAPIYVITFIWIWFPFVNEQELLFLNHLLMLFIFDTVYSMMGLIFYSMPAEMAITSKERGNIMLYTTALGAIGMFGSILVPLIYLGEVPDIEGFRISMIILGIISGVVIYISSYYIKENKYTQMEETLGFKDSIKQSFKNKPFLIVEVAIFSMVVMQQIITGYFIFLFDYVVDLEINALNIILFLIGFTIIGFAIFWLNTHFEEYGVKKLIRIGASIAVIGFLALLILSFSLNINQKNRMSFVLMFGPLLGIILGLIGFMLLSQPLMADCIDYDEVLTGKRRETTYSGINALITKPAVSVGRISFLLIIAAYGYKEGIADPVKQDLSVATGVILAFTLVPIVCLIIGIIALRWYPLDGEDWRKQKLELQKIHIAKEKEYIEFLKKQGIIENQKEKKELDKSKENSQ